MRFENFMRSITKENVEKLLNGSGKVSNTVKKLKTFAEDSNNFELAEWCFKELNGYNDDDTPTH
jgi:hypothetical protein